MKTWRWLRSRLRPGIAILGYHRIHDARHDLFGLSVTPQNFEEQLAVLSRRARVLSLPDAARAIVSGQIPPRAVALTFDDGYSDNLYSALPLLEKFAMPAAVFVVSSAVGREFWWDTIARIVERCGPGLERSHPHGGGPQPWRHRERLDDGPQDTALKRRLAETLAAPLEAMTETERTAAIGAIQQKYGTTDGQAPEHRAMSVDELKRLAASELIEIGAHTATHRALAVLPPEEQREEILRGRTDLESLTASAVTSFAYPNGSLAAETIELVAAAGFTVGCCSVAEPASRNSNVLALPRLWPANQNGEEFERWLGRWIHG